MQSESSDGLIDGAIWGLVKCDNWCVPGDFVPNFYFRLYRLGIYTNKDLGMINKSIKKNQIIENSRSNQEC